MSLKCAIHGYNSATAGDNGDLAIQLFHGFSFLSFVHSAPTPQFI